MNAYLLPIRIEAIKAAAKILANSEVFRKGKININFNDQEGAVENTWSKLIEDRDFSEYRFR